MNERTPLVSVIVPVYNAGSKLRPCIRSIIKQTYPYYELILIDDGSTDNSGKICDCFAEKDARIRVIHQENQGSVAARRKGVVSCKGEYACFCDADDTMPSNALLILLDTICDTDICVGNSEKMWRGIRLKRQHQSPCFQINEPVCYDHEAFISELYCSWFGISNLPVSLWAKLFRVSVLKKAYDAIPVAPPVVKFLGEDLIVTLNAMPMANKISITPQIVYRYRMGGGTSKYNPNMLEDWISLYRYKRKFIEKYPMPQDTEQLMDIELCNMVFTYFHMLARSEQFTNAELLKNISEVIRIPDIVKASENPSIMPEQFQNVRMIRSNKPDDILSAVLLDTAKYKKTKLIRKFIKRFA